MKKVPKSSAIFFCEKCNYTTSRKSQYNRHLMTAKHKFLINPNEKSSAASTEYTCECGRIYKHLSSLCAHKKLCTFAMNEYDIVKKESIMQSNNDKSDSIMELIKQNQDFKSLLIQQQKENQSLQKQLIEAVKDGSKTINNTTNNNQKFNLNFFLNTTCKDAMNMSEFIENINIDLHELEDIGRQGYVTGMTNMILSRIKDMDVTKRPLHCTDLKRETMYIKENDEWSKETPDNIRLRNMIKIVGNNNMTALPAWREKHPECQISEHPQYEFCIDMMRNILGDVGEEQKKLENKVIKNLSRHLLVNKGL